MDANIRIYLKNVWPHKVKVKVIHHGCHAISHFKCLAQTEGYKNTIRGLILDDLNIDVGKKAV